MISYTGIPEVLRYAALRWRHACLHLVLGLCATVTLAQNLTDTRLPILRFDVVHDSLTRDSRSTTVLHLLNAADGGRNRFDDMGGQRLGAAIKLRGSSSLNLFPKTGYGFELKGADGEDTSAVLLGMPKEEDWVLHGPYSDKSLVRNALVYDLARDLMAYAPRSRFVELMLRDDYRGIYLLVEKIKRDKQRVDVAKLLPSTTSGDSLTGGYILKFDKTTGEDFSTNPVLTLPPHRYAFAGKQRTEVVYVYPKAEDLAPEQRQYIASWLTDFEQRLVSRDFDDLNRGYMPLVDLRSFVDFFIINELAKNIDGYRLSTFFSKQRDSEGGRLVMGPVWDFNIAIGNADYCQGAVVQGWVVNFPQVCPNDGFQPTFWFVRLLQSQHFRQALKLRWQELRRAGVLSNSALQSRIDSLAAVVGGDPATRNFARWPVLGTRVWPNAQNPRTHQQAVEQLESFLLARAAWMDGAIDGLTVDTRAPTHAIDDLHISMAPNPGRGEALKIIGLETADYPAEITWYNAAGQVLAKAALAKDEQAPSPPRVGLYFYRIETHRQQEHLGSWLRILE